jgi:hypothetical protein
VPRGQRSLLLRVGLTEGLGAAETEPRAHGILNVL